MFAGRSLTLVVSTLCLYSAFGFSPAVHRGEISSSARFSGEDLSEDVVPEQVAVEFQKPDTKPRDYKYNTLPADYGLTTFYRSEAIQLKNRDAELRHGRLAMLAAVAWPIQELFSPTLARFANRELKVTGLSDLLAATGGKSPSVLNGGLDQPGVYVFLAIVAAAIAAIDLASIRIKDRDGKDYEAGNFDFDPLNLMGGASAEAVRDMQAKEVNNGRVAMLAVTSYVVEEAVTGKPVVDVTPLFFRPFENSLFSPLFNTDILDQFFGIASAAQRLPAEDVASMFPNGM